MRSKKFKKKKKETEITLAEPIFEVKLPEIYRGIQEYESDSDRFCTFDEDYFVGENYAPRSRRIRKRIPDPKTPPSFLFGILCGALSILLISGSIAFLSLFSKLGGIYTSVTVPDLTSLTESEAISLIKNNYKYFDYSVEYKENPDVPSGSVISQIPSPSTMRKLYGINGRIRIKLTVSLTNEQITLPNVVGQNARDVILELKNAGINVLLNEVYSDKIQIGKIISSSHSSGSRLQKNDTVQITASLGKKANYISTPNLVGMSESEAISLLKRQGLDVNKVIYQSSPFPLGTVLEQSISHGSYVREGSKISLYVSGGSYND